ncbi:MAG: beta strand repeat-containing protein, partial [Candidatus Acidiferrales bacterium]
MVGCGPGIATVDQQTTSNPSGGGSGTATIGGTGDSAPPPSVTGVSPNSGPASGGTMVTISGTNFHQQAQVLVGGLPPASFTVQNSSTIVATTAPHAAGSVEVQVTNPDGQRGILLNAFTYDPIPAPFITTVSPNGGPSSGGTLITITGGNFISGAIVLVGGSPATSVTLLSSTQLTAVTPGGSGTVDVQVRNPDGQIATLSGTFSYTLVAPPNIQSVNPTSGPASGGTQVTITGADFVSGASVVMGGVAATGVTFVNATELTAVTPAHTPGVVSVVVRNPDNQTDTALNAFTYLAPPSMASITPTSGPAAGATTVTITGANFRPGATVRFGAIASASVTVNSSGQIQAVTPASAPGTVSVTVVNTDGQSATLSSAFTYTGLSPTISSVSPLSGPLAGGTAVDITGSNFVTGAAVTFGGAPAASVVVASSTQIQAVSPPGAAAGAVDVRVTNPDLSVAVRSNGFTYVAAPLVQSVTPNSGTTAGGTFVTISGAAFQPGATVLFGATAATNVVVSSGTTIVANTPAGAAGAVNVSVRNPDQQVGTLNNGFTYVAIPAIVSINPTSGPAAGGTPVTISGANFVNGAAVRFGATAAASVTFNSATSLTAVTPAGTGLVDVTVTNPGGQSATLSSAFSYDPGLPPTIVSVVPNSGPATGGTLVTISGANFQAGATVSFAGTPATNVTVLSSSQIRAVTPAGAPGSVAVQVTNPDTQNVTLFNGFTYAPPPTVTSVNPAAGFAVGGTSVSVLGSNFQSGAAVFFGGVAAPAVAFVNAGQLSVTTPAHAPGAVSVLVTNPDGQSSTLANGFTYQPNPAPSVLSVNPNAGPSSGIDFDGSAFTVTVSGSNFLPGAAVLFGGVPGAVSGVSPTQINVAIPAHIAGTFDLEVRNADGQ